MAARLRDGCVDRLRELLREGATKEVGEDRGAGGDQVLPPRGHCMQRSRLLKNTGRGDRGERM